jgi:hypothetical protein
LRKVLRVQRDDEVGISVLGTITNVIVVRVRRKTASWAGLDMFTLGSQRIDDIPDERAPDAKPGEYFSVLLQNVISSLFPSTLTALISLHAKKLSVPRCRSSEALLQFQNKNRQRLEAHWRLVRGTPEHHPEGAYYLRYRINGTPMWEHVGDDPEHALVVRGYRVDELAHPNTRAGKILAQNCKADAPEPSEESNSEKKFFVDEEIKTYLTNCQKLAPKTYKAYRLTS